MYPRRFLEGTPAEYLIYWCQSDPLLRLVLEASYEATICAAILNSVRNGNNRLFLTLLGGGAFGNETDWIIGGIQRALNLYKHVDLDVAIVSYGSSNQYVHQLVNQLLE